MNNNRVKMIIREVIDNYVMDDIEKEIRCVIFDFDLTLVNTLPFKGTDKERVRQGDMSEMEPLIPQTAVYNGIPQLLSYLKQNGIRIGVVSNRHESVVNATLRYHGIGVDVVIGERLNCPKSIRIREALQKLGTKPKNAIYVGDSPFDDVEAMKCGVEFIGATWGNKKLKMGYNSPDEVVRYVEYMNG